MSRDGFNLDPLVRLSGEVSELIDLNIKLETVSEEMKNIRRLADEQSYLLMLLLAVHATEAGLINPGVQLANDIKSILAERRISAEVACAESAKDQ